MKELFQYDNPVWRFIGKLADMVFLSLLWLVCSIPVATMGASAAALYEVTLKMAEDQEGYVAASFFRAFRENIRQGTAAGLVLLAVLTVLGGDLYLSFHMAGNARIIFSWIFLLLMGMYLMTAVHIFPLMARYRMNLPHLFAAAFVLAVRYFGWTLLMLASAACLAAAGMFVMAPLLVIVPGGAAYIQSKIVLMLWSKKQE